jgi:hypothetical protein
MNNIFENRLSMYQKVNGYLALHATETTSISAVATLKTQLDANINSILNLAMQADADITGATVDKQNKRNALKAATIKVSTAVVAHGAITNNNRLLEKCDVSISSLDFLRDNDFYKYCKLVQAEAQPIAAALVPYGITAANITAIDTAAAVFLVNIQDPRITINEGAKMRLEYEIKFTETNDLLTLKLDKVMGIFSSTNPSLYFGYQGARSIDDTGSVTEPDYTGEVAPTTILEIAKIPYLKGRTFYIKNTGTVPLLIALDIVGKQMQGVPVNVLPNSNAQRLSFNLNTDGTADVLHIQNIDASTAGSYEIRIVE